MSLSASHMREYETIYVINSDVADDVAIAFIQKMKGLVEREGGKHIKISNWGRRKLAWERLKQQKGMYVHHRYLGKPGIVAEYERNLGIEETILLKQTVLLNKAVDPSSISASEDILQPPIVKEREDKRRYDEDPEDRFFGERDWRMDEDGDVRGGGRYDDDM